MRKGVGVDLTEKTQGVEKSDFSYNGSMGYERHFKGTIWTNHALERLKQRGISQGDAWAAWRRPDQSRYASTKGAWIFYRTWGDEKIEVVAKQNEKKEWVILSVWSRPVYHKKRGKARESWLMRLVKKLFWGQE